MRTMRIRCCLLFVFAAFACAAAHVNQAKTRSFRKALEAGKSAVRRHDYPAAESSAARAEGLIQTPAERVAVRLLRADIAFCSGKAADARRAYDEITRDGTVDAAQRFSAYAGLLCTAAKKRGMPQALKSLKEMSEAVEAADVTAEQKYAAFNEVARSMTHLRDYEMAREFLALADRVAPRRPKKAVRCRYMKNPPLGAAGWLLSDFIKDPANKETRFHDYNQKAADRLFADITAERSVANDGSKKGYFFRNTGFYMVYDEAGWHVFVSCGDRDIQDKLAEGSGAGALEMFFTPGLKGEVYRQWIINQPSGDVSLYEWNSPHRHFRPLEGYFKTETVVSGEDIGTYIFIPWGALYDKLPLNGETWRFGCIRWSPAGGLTWGGKVHETGEWGHIQFDRPTPEQAHVIKKNVARKAWGKYKKTKGALTARWTDEMTGDPEFYNEMVKPAIERLDAYGARLKDHRSLTRHDVAELFTEAVPDWMEFGYLVSELRREYLEGVLVAK